MVDQSVTSFSWENGTKLPSTTLFIICSISPAGVDPASIRITNSEIVLSDTPYRLIASVIYPNHSVNFLTEKAEGYTLFVGFRFQRTSECMVLVRKAF